MRRVFVTAAVAIATFVASITSAGGPLPPVDARCTADADCGVTFLSLAPGQYQCCVMCGTSTAGNKAWVAGVEAACKALVVPERRCPALACPSGPRRATCDHGTCKLAVP